MTLCVYGAQPLNELKALTGQYFNELPDRRSSGSSGSSVGVGGGVGATSSSDDPALAWWGKIPAYLPQECASVLEVYFTYISTHV